MDAQKFGAFIASRRKENHMTQAELAQKLKVTDKAVSRWERGKGFPDISILVPLSEALEVSVLELMRSEKMEERNDTFSGDEVKNMLAHMSEMEKRNRREDRLITWISVPVAVITAFLAVVSGRASILVAVMFAGMAALAVTGACMFLFAVRGSDAAGRRAYGACMLIGTAAATVFMYLMGIDSLWLIGALFLLLCMVVTAAAR